MIKKIFIDSDVILDVATGRIPFVDSSNEALSIIESGLAFGVISSNSVTNIYYVLRKLSSSDKAKIFINTIIKYLSIIPVDHDNIVKALASQFIDFEDGVQNYCAASNQCDIIVTRNIDDYKMSELKVLLPQEFVALYK
ncbi:MAG: PIN domain-containing protein [Spirochaetales bacterium]|nr:PIN domain-containing protein [Spirochaetales bacterium]